MMKRIIQKDIKNLKTAKTIITETFFIEHSKGRSRRKSLFQAVAKLKEANNLGVIYKVINYSDGSRTEEQVIPVIKNGYVREAMINSNSK